MEWKDPPAKGARSSKWMKIFTELKANPNRWAELYTGKSHNAYSLAGRLRPRHPEFEIIARKIEDGRAGVYAQYSLDIDLNDLVPDDILREIAAESDLPPAAGPRAAYTDGLPSLPETTNDGGGAGLE